MEGFLLTRPEQIAEDHFLLRIKSDSEKPDAGQFINIKVSGQTDPLLRRPFSVFDYNDGIMEIIIRVVGKGTSILSSRDSGPIDFLGPLGNLFPVSTGKKVMLIGGGVGNAPLYMLAKKLKSAGCSVDFIYGARSSKYIYLEEKFRGSVDNLFVTTDDGSAGYKGYAVDLFAEKMKTEKFDAVYTCGPVVLMKKCVEVAGNTAVYVSLENYFGCGFGICSGCTVQTSEGQKRACVDGPVFAGSTIDWGSLRN